MRLLMKIWDVVAPAAGATFDHMARGFFKDERPQLSDA